jgi:hypothetical protein
MRRVTDDSRRRPRPELSSVDIDGCVSVYSPATERVLTLNETASAIWRLTVEDHTVDEIVDILASTYTASAEQIRSEVERTLATFESEGLYADAGSGD